MERALLEYMDEDDAMTALQVLHPWLTEVERLRSEAESTLTRLREYIDQTPYDESCDRCGKTTDVLYAPEYGANFCHPCAVNPRDLKPNDRP